MEVPTNGKLWGTFEFITTDPDFDSTLRGSKFNPGLLRLELVTTTAAAAAGNCMSDQTCEQLLSELQDNPKTSQDVCFSVILCSGASIIIFSVCISLALFVMRFIGYFGEAPREEEP